MFDVCEAPNTICLNLSPSLAWGMQGQCWFLLDHKLAPPSNWLKGVKVERLGRGRGEEQSRQEKSTKAKAKFEENKANQAQPKNKHYCRLLAGGVPAGPRPGASLMELSWLPLQDKTAPWNCLKERNQWSRRSRPCLSFSKGVKRLSHDGSSLRRPEMIQTHLEPISTA